MNRARLFVAVAAFVLVGSGIYAATDSQAVSLFSHLPSELQTTENGLGELTYYLLYDQPVEPAVFRHSRKVGIEPRGESAVETGAVLSASVAAAVTTQPQAAQLTYYNPQVLGTSEISEDYLNRLILNNLAASVATGWIASGASVAGLQRASDSPRFAAPSISSQHSTAEIADVNKLLTAKDLTVTSDATISGDLNVAGATALSSLTVSGDAILQGTLSVTGDTSLNGNLNVAGTITGNISGTVNPGFTTGSVVFQGASGLAENNSNLFWDDTNSKLGIGTSAPAATLHVKGNLIVDKTGVTIDPAYSSSNWFVGIGAENSFLAGERDVLIGLRNSVSGRRWNYIFGNDNMIDALPGSSGSAYNFMFGNNNSISDPAKAHNAQYSYLVGYSNKIDVANGNAAFNSIIGSRSATLQNTTDSTIVGMGSAGVIVTQSSTTVIPNTYTQILGKTSIGVAVNNIPNARLQVKGAGSTSSTYTAQFQNSTGTSNSLVIRDDGFVGIGTASPSSILQLAANGSIEQLITRASNDSSVPALGFQKSRGTLTAPLVTGNGDGLGQINFYGYDGTAFLTAASINVQSEGVATGAIGGRLRFYTATSSGTNTERMRIDSVGNIGVGITSPTSKLHIVGTGSFSAAGVSSLNLGSHTVTLTASPSTFRSAEIGAMTLSASSAQTVTTASSLYVATPIAGSNVTITNNKPIDTQTTAYLSSGGTWTNASSRDLKENFTALDPVEVLEKIDSMNIERWNYKAENASITHIGPVAEEFHAAFNTGGTEGSRTISTIDPAGVALLGIQGLSAKVKALLDLSWIIEGFKQFGIEINQELTKIKSLAVDKLQIGSQEAPSGFVMYDKATKEAYCVEIENGEFVKTKGECNKESELEQNSEANTTQNGYPAVDPVSAETTIEE